MLTPQEVASHAFAKATLGGYNMAMVDEFLDTLTADYTTLYNDNAILKNKLKVLSETVEEYRATDNAMRKTLLAAQQMAETMVSDAEKQKAALVQDAERQAQDHMDGLRQQFSDQEHRLQRAKEITAAYLKEVRRAQEEAMARLDQLEELTAGVQIPDELPNYSSEPAQSSFRITIPEPPAAQAEPEPVAAAPADPDLEATRRFDDLQFGKDYEIK